MLVTAVVFVCILDDMIDYTPLYNLIIIYLSAFLGGTAAKLFRLPVLVGYLISGLITGSLYLKFIPQQEALQIIAEIGVALLMFSLGLDFSLKKLREMGSVIIFCSLIQILLTVIISGFIFPFFGFGFFPSLFLGTVFSLSSTAVSIKNLSDSGELDSLHGKLSSGWLFMQDLYTLPIMILIPGLGRIFSGSDTDAFFFLIFLRSILIAAAAFFLIILAGKRIMPFILEKIADFKSRELTLLASVLICLIFSSAFVRLGFSSAVGAFIAGMLIASSSVRHGIFSEMRPLRDMFSVIFFVTLGMILDARTLISSLGTVLLITLIVIAVKFTVSYILVLISGYHTKTSVLTALSLVSVGEFAFILSLNAANMKLIDASLNQTVLSVSFVSIILSVPMFAFSHKIYSAIRNKAGKRIPILRRIFEHIDRAAFVSNDIGRLKNHIVILGYGRVGKYIGRALTLEKIPFIVIDYDHKIVRELKEEGIRVIYGDPAEYDVLKYANVSEAKTVVVAYYDRSMQDSLITNILNINSSAKIICRTHLEEDQRRMKSFGVSMVVQPEFEAAKSITEKLLSLMGISDEEIKGKIIRLKIEHGMS